MTGSDDWRRWSETWQEAGRMDSAMPQVLERIRRARRMLALTAALETVLVLVAVGGLGAALWHATDAADAILGACVAAAIIGAWIYHILARRREAESTTGTATEYVAIMRRFYRRQLAFVRFVWVVLALEGVFLARWWSGGLTAHRGDLVEPLAIVSLWCPLAAMMGLTVWTIRVHQSARSTLRRLDRIHHDLQDKVLRA
jgi:hypothetical protein